MEIFEARQIKANIKTLRCISDNLCIETDEKECLLVITKRREITKILIIIDYDSQL